MEPLDSTSLTPKVSVLMSVYNGERYLREAIDSILTQSFNDFEFIIFEDGSTDNSANILQMYKEKDRRIKVIYQHNQGLSASMNLGMEVAKGEYFIRMDADDISLPDRFEKQVAFMETHPDVGICGSWMKFIGDGKDQVIEYPTDPNIIRARMFFLNPFPHPGMILRASIFKKFPELRYRVDCAHAEDYELFSRCAEVAQVANIPEVLLLYRIHSNQVSRAEHEISVSSQRKVREYLIKRLLNPTQEEMLLNEYLCIGWDIPPDKKQISKAEKWLIKVDKINQEKKVYPNPEFSREIAGVWFRLIQQTESDFRIFWKILASPFYKNLPINWYGKWCYCKRSLKAILIKIRTRLNASITK